MKENSLDGTVFGTVVADDYDANESLSFFIDDSAGGLFRLGANTSCIKVQNRTVGYIHYLFRSYIANITTLS